MARRILAVILLLLLGGARAEVGLFFTNVGKGDAIILIDGDYAALIDTGKKKAADRVLEALAALDVDHIDDLFITHGDRDHSGGLKKLLGSGLEISRVHTSAYADVRAEDIRRLAAGDTIETPGGAFTVLAPTEELYGSEDNNSLVMRYDSPDGSVLLTGDMELAEESLLLRSGTNLKCDVLKVPNHGDDDACGDALIAACGARVAVISASTAEKSDTPSARVLAALADAGCETFVTQDSVSGILVTLNGGDIAISVR